MGKKEGKGTPRVHIGLDRNVTPVLPFGTMTKEIRTNGPPETWSDGGKTEEASKNGEGGGERSVTGTHREERERSANVSVNRLKTRRIKEER